MDGRGSRFVLDDTTGITITIGGLSIAEFLEREKVEKGRKKEDDAGQVR